MEAEQDEPRVIIDSVFLKHFDNCGEGCQDCGYTHFCNNGWVLYKADLPELEVVEPVMEKVHRLLLEVRELKKDHMASCKECVEENHRLCTNGQHLRRAQNKLVHTIHDLLIKHKAAEEPEEDADND